MAVDWDLGVARLLLDQGGKDFDLRVHGLRSFAMSREHPLETGGQVENLSLRGAGGVYVRMRSGDQIVIDGDSVEPPPSEWPRLGGPGAGGPRLAD